MERRRFFLSALAAVMAPLATAAAPASKPPIAGRLRITSPECNWPLSDTRCNYGREIPIVHAVQPVGGRVVWASDLAPIDTSKWLFWFGDGAWGHDAAGNWRKLS